MSSLFFEKIQYVSSSIPPIRYSDKNDTLYCNDNEKIEDSGALLYQLHNFLSMYYEFCIISIDDLKVYFLLWKYESLINTLIHAQTNSYFYSNSLKINDLTVKFETFKKEILSKKCKFSPEVKNKINTKIIDLLKLIPLTSDKNINYDYNVFLAVNHDDIKSIVSVETSGTKKSKRVYSSNSDLNSTIDFYYYGMHHILRNKTNKIAILFSSEREGSVGRLMIEAMKKAKIECKVFSLSTNFINLKKLLLDYSPTCLIGIPWHVHQFSLIIKDTPLASKIESVLLSGDVLSLNLKSRIEENLNCRVYEHYGLTEFGLGGAVEYNKKNELLIRGLDTYIEILDEDENPILDSEYGEITITSLTREAMPFIRYKTGDIGRFISHSSNKNYIFDYLEVKSRSYESVHSINSSLELYDIQNLFYSNKFIYDLEVAIFYDISKNNRNLVLAVDFLYDDYPEFIIMFLNECKDFFEKMYNLDYLDVKSSLSDSQKETSSCFCFIKMQEYKNLTSNYSDINEEIKKNMSLEYNNISPKKKVKEFSIDFKDIYPLIIKF